MYENLIQRTPISNKLNNLSVRLPTMPVNEKVAYVESVCAALIDDRFGRRWNPFIIDIGHWPEDGAEGFDDLTVDGWVPFYPIRPDSKTALRDAPDIVRRELAKTNLTMAAMRVQSLPASNLGRGSPKISWDELRVSTTCGRLIRTTCGNGWLNTANQAIKSLGRTETNLIPGSTIDRSLKNNERKFFFVTNGDKY